MSENVEYQQAQVPLWQLLKDVPYNHRLIIDIEEPNGWKSSHHIPVGVHCHQAADMLKSYASDKQEIGCLADLYYQNFAHLPEDVRKKLSMYQLREIFDKMVKPSLKSWNNPKPPTTNGE